LDAGSLYELSWEQVKELLNETDIVLVPVGSLEQHGPHLPLGTDSIIASEVARKAAEKAKVAVTPVIPFGFSIEHMSFPGTISLEPETLLLIVKNISVSLVSHGFKKIVFINAHGGNTGILTTAIQLIKNETNIFVALVSVWDLAFSEFKKIRESRPGKINHAEEFETSLIKVINPSLIQVDRLKRISHFVEKNAITDLYEANSKIKVAWKIEDYSKIGILGEPTKASVEKGKRLLNSAIDNLTKFLIDLKFKK
jgi:creatinine amidohydrolase